MRLEKFLKRRMKYFLIKKSEEIVSNEKVEHLVEMIQKDPDPKVVMIGVSHSTFSALTNILSFLKKERVNVPEGTFEIVAKKNPQFFFESIDEARDLGFTDDFLEDQICPETKRINTASGLRGFRRDLALKILKGEERRVCFGDVFVKDSEISNKITSATSVIQATGHVQRARDIDFFDKKGDSLQIGAPVAGLDLRINLKNTKELHNIFALGATAQPPFNPKHGGEKRSRTGNTAVRFYERHARVIIDQILGLNQ